MKKVRITACTGHCFASFTLWHRHVLKNQEEGVSTEEKMPGVKIQIGRERPHFLGFQPPKKFVGSLPPGRRVRCH